METKYDKTVMMAFVDRRINPKEHITDIKNAIEYANLNLAHRNGITINNFTIDSAGFMQLTLSTTEDKISNIGYHLKGIAQYLFRSCEFPYRDYRIGTRLLVYYY